MRHTLCFTVHAMQEGAKYHGKPALPGRSIADRADTASNMLMAPSSDLFSTYCTGYTRTLLEIAALLNPWLNALHAEVARWFLAITLK